MDFQQYRDLKEAAPAPGEVKPGAGLSPLPAAPPTLGPLHCNGLGQSAPVVQGFFPPDTHGAVGANHFGQIVNSGIKFYSKALTGNCPTSNVLTLSLFGFFGYTAQALFDPRILCDLTYNRWIVSAEAFPESTVQRQFIAVSVDSGRPRVLHLRLQRDRLHQDKRRVLGLPQIFTDEDAVIRLPTSLTPATSGTVVWLPKHRIMRAGLCFCFSTI
jgi:hypothetical protein